MLDEMLSAEQLIDWFEYYRQRPFGHWVDNEMRAAQIHAWTGKYQMPEIVEPLDTSDMSDEEKTSLIPGGGGAFEFLKGLKA